MNLGEIGSVSVSCINLVCDMVQWPTLLNTLMNLHIPFKAEIS
jgi:hypothetical protein